jgi:zinc protease
MKALFRAIPLLILVLALSACSQVMQASNPSPDPKGNPAVKELVDNKPVRFKLDNGFTVILKENHEAPVVAMQVWVEAGSAFELPNEYGITHYIEHMIFKGTPSDPDGEVAKRIEDLGGDINAYTTLDHTNYWAVTPSYAAEEVLEKLGDAVVNAKFDPEEMRKEKEVVIEEIRMGQDSPGRRRSKKLMAAVFGKDHPYGRPVIGTIASVKRYSREDVLNYRKRLYRAPNMLLIMVGDFDAAKMVPRIKRLFAPLDSKPVDEFVMPPARKGDGPSLVVMKEKVKQASLSFAWPIPGLPSDEVYALDMAGSVAGDAETSRLNAVLKEKLGLVDSVGAYAYTPKGVGFFSVSASLNPAKLDKAWPAMLEQILGFINDPPSADELNKARVALTSAFIRQRQTMKAQANNLGYFEMMRGGFEQVDAYTERYKKVTAQQVSAAIKKYLTLDNMRILIQTPENTSLPDLAELKVKAGNIYAKLAAKPAPVAQKAVKKELSNGLTLIVRPRNSLPLISYELIAPGGSAAENKNTSGVHSLWARTVTRGSKNYSYEQLAETLDSLAGSISASSGRNFVSMSGSFLAGDARKGLEMMADAWLHPSFAPEQIKRAKAEQMAALRRQQSSPQGRLFVDFRKVFYGDHPYSLNPLGSMESLAMLDRVDLQAAHQKMRGPRGLVLSVVGQVNPDKVADWAVELFGAGKGLARQPDYVEVKAPQEPRRKVVVDNNAKQTQIVLGYLAPSARNQDRHALSVLQTILGGMGGRLFRDLRDQRSLAYSVGPFYSQGYQLGVFGIYMGVGPGKEKEALAGLREHLDRVRNQPPSQEEMKAAKAQILGGLAIGLQSYGALASTLGNNQAMGRGYLYHKELPQKIRAVTAEDVRRVAAKYLDPLKEVRLTLGPAK